MIPAVCGQNECVRHLHVSGQNIFVGDNICFTEIFQEFNSSYYFALVLDTVCLFVISIHISCDQSNRDNIVCQRNMVFYPDECMYPYMLNDMRIEDAFIR